MRVAVIQQQNTADLDANLARSMDKIREAVAQGAQLVMLQELHRSLYFCQSEDTAMFDLAETVPGPSTCLLYTSPSPRDRQKSRMPSSA